ncbi:MAG TPA: DUF2380 domain-containing protein [Methylophilaceae bacterium]|nr:DUF2380 domain-containing protein [Methylophilaceae bacterium]
MKRLLNALMCICLLGAFLPTSLAAQTPRVMALDVQLDDRTGIPDAPEEIERIRLLTESFKKALAASGIALVPANDKLKAAQATQSATYLFDNVEHAAELAGDDADYLIIVVALKPTYLFVYPRLLMIDVKTRKVVLAKATQLESSWSDQNTTINNANRLAEFVKAKLVELAGK